MAGAGDAGSVTSSSELELGAEEPAPAASTAAAVAADSRRGRCIRPRTPARPVKADSSADDMRPKMAQNLPASRGLQPWAVAALKASSALATQ